MNTDYTVKYVLSWSIFISLFCVSECPLIEVIFIVCHTFINMHACVLHLNKLFVCAHVCLYYCIVDAFSHKVCKELILGLLITSPNRNNLNLWCLFREWSMIRHAHTSASFIRILHQSCPHPSWHDLQISFMQIFHFKRTFRIHKFLSFLAWLGQIS